MKNFFKKLSFVLAIAMVLTSIAPATASAAVSEKNVPVKKVNVKYDGEKVDSINLDVEETKTIKLGLPVTKAAKAAGFTKTTFATAVKVADDSVVEVVKVSKRLYEITGVAAGETTITFGAAKTKKLAKAGEFKKEATLTVVVEAEAEAEVAIEATGAQQLTVNFGQAVDTTAVTLELKKGTVTVNLDDAAFSADKTSYVFNTTGKLTKGTYTVTVKGLAEEDVVASVDVVDEYVAEIVLLDEGKSVAVNEDGTELYTYYEVYNQYGESVKNTANVTWSTSAKSIVATNSTGKLKIETDADNAFTYGSAVYVVGTYTKGTNVASVTGTVNVGLEAKADTVEFLGTAKVSTSTLSTVPVDFRNGEYALLFKVYDQYGYEMESMLDVSKLADSITFTSATPLTVAGPTVEDDAIEGGLSVNGDVYCAIKLSTGNYSYKGGSAQLSAISSKTGTISNYTVNLGDAQILTSFTLGAPSNIIAEGEFAVIPFTALDQNGEAITNFRTLAGQVTLTNVMLCEADNGAAYLLYIDDTDNATETTDIPVVLTSVVTGTGDYSSVTLYIKNAAVPTVVSGLGNWKGTHVTEGDSVSLGISNYYTGLHYQDQYGRSMDGLTNTENGAYDYIKGYFDTNSYKVMASYTGNAFVLDGATKTTEGTTQYVVFDDENELTITAVSGEATTVANGALKFVVVEYDAENEEWVGVTGDTKSITFTSVDMSQYVDFAVTTNYSPASVVYGGVDAPVAAVQVYGILSNGVTVQLPEFAYSIATNAFYVGNNPFNLLVAEGSLLAVTGSAANISADVYVDQSVVLSDGEHPEVARENPFTVTVKDPEQANTTISKVKATQKVAIADPDVYVNIATTAKVVDGKATINAADGKITEDLLLRYIASYSTTYSTAFNNDTNGDTHFDVFTAADGITLTVSKVKESDKGLRDGVTITGNGEEDILIAGVEIGDTFTVTYYLPYTSVSVDFTVGADSLAVTTGDVPDWR